MEEKKRLIGIDILRGIGVFLIILSHTPITRNLVGYNYSFQLGIFFFLSGYLFSWKKFSNFKEFFKSRVKSILLPYFGLSLISIIFYIFYYHMPYYDYHTLKDMLFVLIFGARNAIFYNIPLGFLPTLFLMENFYYLLKRYGKNDIIIIPAIFYLSMLGFIVFNALNKTNVFGTGTAGAYYLIFFAMGNFIREYQGKMKNKIFPYSFLLIALTINISMYIFPSIYFSILVPQSISFNSLKLYFIAISIMLSGTYVSCFLAQKIKKAKGIEYLSHNSLIFFGLHIPAMGCVRSVFNKFNIHITQKFNLEGLIYTFLIILILIPISYIINRFLSFVVGKRKGVEK